MQSRVLAPALVALLAPSPTAAQGFTLDQVLSAPFPSSLTASHDGSRIAWVQKQRGEHSIRVAEGPDFEARRIWQHAEDDGTSVSILGFVAGGDTIVFSHGGSYNPAQDPGGAPGRKLYGIAFAGGEATRIADVGGAVLSPSTHSLAFDRGGELFVLDLREDEEPERVLEVRGSLGDLQWSPDGSRLAFAVGRRSFDERYGYVAVFDLGSRELRYLDASIHQDRSPRWSPDGNSIAFLRRLGEGGASNLTAKEYPVPDPWEVRVADLESGETRSVYRDPVAFSHARLQWRGADSLVVLSERDGWPRLYRLRARGGRARPLSPERAWVEDFAVGDSGDVYFSCNANDIDRRHLWVAPMRGRARALTEGDGIEWGAVPTGDGRWVAHYASSATEPAHLEVRPAAGGDDRWLARETLPDDFPGDRLVQPQSVVVTAADGTAVHCQLFLPPRRHEGRRPAVMYFHGGPVRQMLLGFHYSGYYHNAYAYNQYLASRGYVVLSVNYRLGIGYGTTFRDVPDGGPRGASEYQDVLAAAAFLRGHERVDPGRIGLWGGSYGGYLTALGLARNSDLFAAGVDLHGVHDWNLWQAWRVGEEEKGDDRTAWKASPIADLDSWRSPVLLVHGDDDRNVPFAETMWLARELEQRGVPHELLVLPDEVHSFLRHASWLQVFEEASDFFDRRLRDRASPHVGISAGTARYEFWLRGTPLEVFTYKPETHAGERMIFVMHGTLRNADDYRDHAQAMGERFGALIVTPRFDRERFPSRLYHHGGLLGPDGEAADPEDWTWRYIPALAEAVRTMEQRPDLPFWIIGHSAGGQFVARMSAFFRTGAERHVAANPGSHLFPTREMPFAYGFGGLPSSLSDDEQLRFYLSAPLTFYLGTADNAPDRYFNTSETAMQQGGGRLQRGRNCFEAARRLAAEKGWPFAWSIVEAEGVGHDHEKMFDHPKCEEALFGVER